MKVFSNTISRVKNRSNEIVEKAIVNNDTHFSLKLPAFFYISALN